MRQEQVQRMHEEHVLRILHFCLLRSIKSSVVNGCSMNTRQFESIIEPLKAEGLIAEEIVHFPVHGTVLAEPRYHVRIFYKTTHLGFLKLKRLNLLW